MEKYIPNINLFNSPILTLYYFFIICFLKIKQIGKYFQKHIQLFIIFLFIIEHFFVLHFTPGFHQKV